MSHRVALAVTSTLAALALGPAAAALAAQPPVPVAGSVFTGKIRFPRAEGMSLSVDARDPSRAKASLGFDGTCKGGGFGEFWASYIPARETLRVHKGRFTAHLTGASRNVGGVSGRTGSFKWKLTGRFTGTDTATATVDGTAVLRSGGHRLSRCKIAHPATVKLTLGA
jgi:hypothetical protein